MDSVPILKMLIDNNNLRDYHKQCENPIIVDEALLFQIKGELELHKQIALQVWRVLRHLSKENSPILKYESVRQLKKLSDYYEGFEYEKEQESNE